MGIVVALVYNSEDEVEEIREIISRDQCLKEHVHVLPGSKYSAILRNNSSGLVVNSLPIFLLKEGDDEKPYTLPLLKYREIFSKIYAQYSSSTPVTINCKSSSNDYVVCVGEKIEMRAMPIGLPSDPHLIHEEKSSISPFILYYNHLFTIENPGEYKFTCNKHGGCVKVRVCTAYERNEILLNELT